MRTPGSSRAFTLVELLVGVTLSSIVLAAMMSTYLYLGRNLTRLSYQRALEVQSRAIITTLITDLRATKAISGASNSALSLIVYTGSGGSTAYVTYTYSGGNFVRNSTQMVNDLSGTTSQVPVTMTACTFNYYTTTDGSPTYQASATLVPLAIKQIEVTFTLQAGAAGTQDQQGTLTQYKAATGRILLVNRQLPDGS